MTTKIGRKLKEKPNKLHILKPISLFFFMLPLKHIKEEHGEEEDFK